MQVPPFGVAVRAVGADRLEPLELAAGGDAELRAGRPRRRTPRGDHGGERESLAASAPPLDVSEDLLHVCIIAAGSALARGAAVAGYPRHRPP
jgi:hypothetical protein